MKKEEQPKPPDSFSGFFIMVSDFTEKLTELSKRLDNMTVQNDNNELFTIDQFCKKFHISKRCFFTWKQKGLISYVQVGSKVLIRKVDIEKFIEEHKL